MHMLTILRVVVGAGFFPCIPICSLLFWAGFLVIFGAFLVRRRREWPLLHGTCRGQPRRQVFHACTEESPVSATDGGP